MGPYPVFSWSHSRDRLLLECTRAYYWRYYGSYGGWREDTDPDRRLAYVLKHLTTLPQLLGTAVHARAREAAIATRARTPRPCLETMLSQVADVLNRAVLGSHHRAAFARDPRKVVMLREAWYGSRRTGAALAAAMTKARRCLRHLEEASIWADLESCRPEWIVVADAAEAFVHDVWPVYAGPDLMYRPTGDRVVIVDWKTGDDAEAELQIPLYALYCRKAFGLRFREGEWFGRVVNLGTGDDTTREIERIDLHSAAERIADSVRAMRTLLASPDRNEPKHIGAFPLIDESREATCLGCSFYALCQEELSAREQAAR